jgi:hypothetical protein
MNDQPIAPLGSPSASAPSREGAPTLGKIGFVGLGHMGTAMSAKLANTRGREDASLQENARAHLGVSRRGWAALPVALMARSDARAGAGEEACWHPATQADMGSVL